jgi:hypothetical protein
VSASPSSTYACAMHAPVFDLCHRRVSATLPCGPRRFPKFGRAVPDPLRPCCRAGSSRGVSTARRCCAASCCTSASAASTPTSCSSRCKALYGGYKAWSSLGAALVPHSLLQRTCADTSLHASAGPPAGGVPDAAPPGHCDGVCGRRRPGAVGADAPHPRRECWHIMMVNAHAHACTCSCLCCAVYAHP